MWVKEAEPTMETEGYWRAWKEIMTSEVKGRNGFWTKAK